MADPISRLNTVLAGRYSIERQLGEGGMATVYLAIDVRHQRQVALKVLKPEVAAAVGAQRFLLEIKTTANLRHPHILPLFDSGEADGFLFYVMPHVDGESLRDRLERERQLPVDEAVRIAINVAEALDHAHRHGVIHRDIKPGNILLQDGKAVISDFGIALAMRATDADRLTGTGLSLGTPHYMSPEQATGDGSIGPATDVYALGCVLYEMLVGEPPFTGRTTQAIIGQIIQSRPEPVTKHCSSVPLNVESAIDRALEKVPADRFASVQDFARALSDPGFRNRAQSADAPIVRRRSGLAAAGWVIGILGLAFGVWSMLQDKPAPASVSRYVLSTQGLTAIDAPFGQLTAIAPDGSSMVLPIGTWPSAYQLGMKQRGSNEIVPIPGTEGASDVIFSPDGAWIAYEQGGKLIKRPLSGGAAVTIAEDIDDSAEGIAWLDDGTILVEQRPPNFGITSPSRIVRIPEDGGAPVQTFESEKDTPYPIWMHGLPDARGALVVTCAAAATCRAEGARLYVLDLERGSFVLAAERVMRAWYVPSMKHIVFVRPDGSVYGLQFELENLTVSGNPTPLLNGVRVGGNRVDMVMSPGGTALYVEGYATAFGLTELVWIDRSGKQQPLDPNLGPRGFTTLALSPDDRFLAVAIETVQSSEIWLKDLRDGPLTRLTGHAAITRWPFWGRDASTVSYINNDGGTPHVRRVRSDGGSRDTFEVVLRRQAPVMEAVYTPDNHGLFFREVPSIATSSVGFMDLSAGRVTQEPRDTGLNEQSIAISPDGRWLAFVSRVTGRPEVYVRRVPDTGGRVQVSANGGVEPVWAHNGRELFYRDPTSGPLIAASYTTVPDFRVLSRQSLFETRAYNPQFFHKTYDVTKDDQRFVFMRPTTGDARLVLIENWFAELRGDGQRPRPSR